MIHNSSIFSSSTDLSVFSQYLFSIDLMSTTGGCSAARLAYRSSRKTSKSYKGYLVLAPNLFECCLCHRRCHTRGCIRKHLLLHEGKFPYYCELCGKGCTSSNQLRGHLSTHTGVKDFSCSCGKTFAYRANWKAHLKKCDASKEQRELNC
ncbi:hypothetical protein LSH36_63g05054 [Paralvinella palmiformis]|uniref:C2H2-type domain-containing protein n=1 Tax=Paralvinella palmiformis TaxID=53620 RepID=A0AAD9K492_9ANNE|nr:hypothetical protein LSH36_63g05054 [Paralvinella palmiformis]